MRHYNGQAFTDIGKVASGAIIAVNLAGTTTKATIYSDDGMTVKPNPFAANNQGNYDFFAPSGKYDIVITGPGITPTTMASEVIFDPFEQSVADAAPQIVPLNAPGVGGFFGVTVYPPINVNTGQVVNAANEIRVFQFTLPFAVSIGRVTMDCTQTAAGTADVGIYSATGTRLLSTNGGINTNPSGVRVSVPIAQAPVLLLPGTYYLAQTATTTITQFFVLSLFWGAASQYYARAGTAANTAVSGVLPATLGTITASTQINPIGAFFER